MGGETAEHPGLLGEDEYDVAGAVTGVVEYDAILGPQRVRAGDVVLGIESSGLHSNGFSLVRRVVADAGWDYGRYVAEFGRTLGEELLTPTHVYAAELLSLIRADGVDVHALSHVTGGGLAANLARVLPQGMTTRVDRGTWTPPAVFQVIQALGRVPQADLERTLNQGVGFVALVAPDGADRALAELDALGLGAWVLGEVLADTTYEPDPAHEVVRGAKGVDGGAVQLVGVHPTA